MSIAVTNREKEVLHELSDDEVREVAGKEVKKHAESIEAFEKAGRLELADKERAEREAVSGYAPTQLTEEQVDALIDELTPDEADYVLKEPSENRPAT